MHREEDLTELNEASHDVVVTQRALGDKGLIVFLALLSAFVPLSTDLYLPALPGMARYFRVDESLTNLTLILFFVFFSLATLVWGPLSDKYGRRPILLVGLGVYALASGLCALSANVYELMLFRVLQAIGGGAASAVSTAIVKDVYRGRRRETTLAVVQSMVVIAPAVAPVVGALLLEFTSWRGVFVTQALLGLTAVLGALLFNETLDSKNDGDMRHTLGRLVVVMRNPAFATLLIIFSLLNVTFLAFISSSSYIYQETFGLSSQVYSYYFAFNALGTLIGPVIYTPLSRRFKRHVIIVACFSATILSGVLVYALGPLRPWAFALCLWPASIAGSCLRPPSTYLMLEEQQGDAGSASALIGSFLMIMGSVGMVIMSLGWPNPVRMIGALNTGLGLTALISWLVLTRRPFLRHIRQL